MGEGEQKIPISKGQAAIGAVLDQRKHELWDAIHGRWPNPDVAFQRIERLLSMQKDDAIATGSSGLAITAGLSEIGWLFMLESFHISNMPEGEDETSGE